MNNFDIITDSDISLEAVWELIDKKKQRIVPVEWYMMTCFARWEIFQNKALAGVFLEFINKYYPGFRLFNIEADNAFSKLCSTIAFYDNRFLKVYGFGITEDNYIGASFELGRIIMDFLIRYCNYSLVDHEKRVITTATEELDERFMTYLSAGYTLNRLDKLELGDIVTTSNAR